MFSVAAVLIACLGLLGLAVFAVEQRKKEIAVRKVLGSSSFRIVTMLTADFLKWVLLANLIAWPAAHFGMGKWLQGFAHRVPLQIWPFFASGLIALVIAMFAISV